MASDVKSSGIRFMGSNFLDTSNHIRRYVFQYGSKVYQIWETRANIEAVSLQMVKIIVVVTFYFACVRAGGLLLLSRSRLCFCSNFNHVK